MSGESPATGPQPSRFGFPFGLQFSLGELLFVAVYLCCSIAAAKSGGLLAWLVAEATIVLAVGCLVAIIYERGVARAFAVGFAIGVAVHGLCVFCFGASEFDPERAKLPYSKIVAPIWIALEPEAYVSFPNGREVPRGDVRTVQRSYDSGQTETRLQDAKGRRVEKVERPAREDFMLVAHALGAAGAGYLMGKLATALYRRRGRTERRTVSAS